MRVIAFSGLGSRPGEDATPLYAQRGKGRTYLRQVASGGWLWLAPSLTSSLQRGRGKLSTLVGCHLDSVPASLMLHRGVLPGAALLVAAPSVCGCGPAGDVQGSGLCG